MSFATNQSALSLSANVAPRADGWLLAIRPMSMPRPPTSRIDPQP